MVGVTLPGPSIPGQTPLHDLSGLKVRGITTQAELNAAEAMNIRKAAVKYLIARPPARRAPFDVRWMMRVHKEMFGDVWAWAGTLRTVELNLGSPAQRVEVDLHELEADLKAWASFGMPLIEQAARLHHRAVSVHPFLNGNGRWARMLASVWLRRHGASATMWPEATIAERSVIRDAYLASVRDADRGDYGALIELHARYGNGDAA